MGGGFGRLCEGEPSVTPAYRRVKNICLMQFLAETNGTAAKLPLTGEGGKEGATPSVLAFVRSSARLQVRCAHACLNIHACFVSILHEGTLAGTYDDAHKDLKERLTTHE